MAKNGGAVAPAGPSHGRSMAHPIAVFASAIEGRFIFSTPTTTAVSESPLAIAA